MPVVPPIANPAAAFGVAMIAVMWAYEGWYYLPFCAGEIKDARRTVRSRWSSASWRSS